MVILLFIWLLSRCSVITDGLMQTDGKIIIIQFFKPELKIKWLDEVQK